MVSYVCLSIRQLLLSHLNHLTHYLQGSWHEGLWLALIVGHGGRSMVRMKQGWITFCYQILFPKVKSSDSGTYVFCSAKYCKKSYETQSQSNTLLKWKHYQSMCLSVISNWIYWYLGFFFQLNTSVGFYSQYKVNFRINVVRISEGWLYNKTS